MYPVLVIKTERGKTLHSRHPWLFSGAVAVKAPAENGDIVRVVDENGRTYGYGFYDVRSEIMCRVFEWTKVDSLSFEAAYWTDKLHKAKALRKVVINHNDTNGYRLIHAEGDGCPGLIIDIYNGVAVCQVLHKGIEKVFPFIKEGLLALGYTGVYCKTKNSAEIIEGVSEMAGWQTTPVPQPLTITENGLQFMVNVETGQKTGFFLDQRDNRALLKQYSQGKTVLNTFAYSGGFSVYALAGGAKEVVSVDSSKEAVAMCEANVTLNFGADTPHTSVADDVFEYLKQTTVLYDCIVLDPPAFAKNARSVPNAARGYKELNIKGFQKLNSGGLLFTFSCSKNIDKHLFRQIVFSAAADAGKNVRILHQMTQPADHPINIYHPEGEYLKGLVLYID